MQTRYIPQATLSLMTDEITLRTERLVLRPWRRTDRKPFAAINADPDVMEWFQGPLTAAQSDAFADWIEQRFHEQGWGCWAVEIAGADPFIGFVGLSSADTTLGYPSVEIGWRLAAAQWGHGYAPEAAREPLRFGFDDLGLDEIVSFTSVGNTKSRRVMTKIGMTRTPEDDFDHPRVPKASPLARHVLYRIKRAAVAAGDAASVM
jgi:RimJ/RimL family protein N-acetyltransferase